MIDVQSKYCIGPNINKDMDQLNTFEVAQMPQQTEVRGPDDDWTGLTDTAERRKRQNRLNQRIYRMSYQALAVVPSYLLLI
jgi:hypothetical protein